MEEGAAAAAAAAVAVTEEGNGEEAVDVSQVPDFAAGLPDFFAGAFPDALHGAPWLPPEANLMPFWDGADESAEHTAAILEFHVRRCPDFQAGFCVNHGSKGKALQCFDYHFESQCRRCPVDMVSGQMLYWDIPCEGMHESGYCVNGSACPFAHGRDEVSYHPAKYKTRLCNRHECRGENSCCFAHSDAELRLWGPERYSFTAIAGMYGLPCGLGGGCGDGGRWPMGGSMASGANPSLGNQKQRFCASFPNVTTCRRGASCAFAHSREEVMTPLFSKEEEEHASTALTETFFTGKFKTLWCPIGAQHDWQSCIYAHTYQDARRKPSIGYGPQPCPFWSKKDTRAAYSQRCPLGLRCPYAHGAKEQLYHPKYFRTVVCRDLQGKGCPRQHLCAFHHSKKERRHVAPDDVDYSNPLPKEAIPDEWGSHFLAPPFFQDGIDEVFGGRPGLHRPPYPMQSHQQMAAQQGQFGAHGPGLGKSRAAGAKASVREESPRTQSTVDESGAGTHSSGSEVLEDAQAAAAWSLSGWPPMDKIYGDGSEAWHMDTAPMYIGHGFEANGAASSSSHWGAGW